MLAARTIVVQNGRPAVDERVGTFGKAEHMSSM